MDNSFGKKWELFTYGWSWRRRKRLKSETHIEKKPHTVIITEEKEREKTHAYHILHAFKVFLLFLTPDTHKIHIARESERVRDWP